MKLKECPKCGCEPIEKIVGGTTLYYVKCSYCNYQSFAKHSPSEAAEDWNRRAERDSEF